MRLPDDKAREERLAALAVNRRVWLAFLARRLPTGVDAEDVLQEALLRVSGGAPPREASRLRPWFFRVLRNAVADAHRGAGREVARAGTVAPVEVAAVEQTPWVCECDEELAGKVAERDRQLLRRVHAEGEPVAAVARDLGLSPNAAYVRLHRARHELRDAILDLCGASTYAEARACACDASSCAAG